MGYYEYDTHGKYSDIEKVSNVGECIDRDWKACQADTSCSMTCAATGPACPAAIAIACLATES
ncbi:hypothetical protein GO491_10395 [Flavobacteriaceae bacterium Ap0902]|nr:hypothetical protein [Flavobacteriaceae bacterium Ap0902]